VNTTETVFSSGQGLFGGVKGAVIKISESKMPILPGHWRQGQLPVFLMEAA